MCVCVCEKVMLLGRLRSHVHPIARKGTLAKRCSFATGSMCRSLRRTVVWVSLCRSRSFAASLPSLPISNTANLDGEPPLLSDVLADSSEVPPLASRLW